MGNKFFGNLFNLKKTARGKSSPSSLPELYPAPEFRGLENWINTRPIASMRQLLGKVVLIDFLTYSCINCLDAIPYVKTWHKKYKGHGLVVLRIQTLEFCFKKNIRMIYAQLKNLDKIFGSSG